MEKCLSLFPEISKEYVSREIYHESDNMSEIFRLESFTQKDQKYVVLLNYANSICRCSCQYLVSTGSACKHIFPAHRVYENSICFDTRIGWQSKNTDLIDQSWTSESPSIEKKNRPVHRESHAAALVENLRSLVSCLEKVSPFSPAQREAIDSMEGQLESFKRLFDFEDRAWSKRQRR